MTGLTVQSCLVMELVLPIYSVKVYLGGKTFSVCLPNAMDKMQRWCLWLGSCLQETTVPFFVLSSLPAWLQRRADWLHDLSVSKAAVRLLFSGRLSEQNLINCSSWLDTPSL